MLAPNHVSAPAAIQTRSMPPNDGTARLTSDGWTKIDEPTIVPTTIAVACVNEMVRANFAVTRAHPITLVSGTCLSRAWHVPGTWLARAWHVPGTIVTGGGSPDRRRL